MNKTIQLIMLLVGFGVLAQGSLPSLLSKYNNQTIPYITVEELMLLQNKTDFLLLDTREKEEFEVSKIEGALLVGFNNFSLKQFEKKLTPKNQLIVVYCSLGVRSEDIGEKLKKAGYTNVKNLYGGIFEWKNNNFPVIDSTGNETQKVHAYSKQWGKWLKKGKKVY